MRVMWPGAGFRVVLNAEQRKVAVTQALERRVVRVRVRQFDFVLRQRVGIYGEVMVVRGDLDLPGVQLLHRMIAAVVPELEFESLAAERDASQLVAEADAEDGLASHEAADIVHGVGAGFGIAGAVREKDAVWFQRKYIFSRSLRRNDRD